MALSLIHQRPLSGHFIFLELNLEWNPSQSGFLVGILEKSEILHPLSICTGFFQFSSLKYRV